ncbi:PRC and DUF2382 domain-containing protein [Actinomadura sp. NPDC049753]|uniref:PRC and DUF2382 domain-containing protein n=1 Tax=Actinomadura sp. NPDC049753 TaxID=3154739 RepID=UPI003433F2E6
MLDHPLYDERGSKVGDVKHVFLDDRTGRPEWLGVKTGMLGAKETYVPAQRAECVSDHVEAGYEKDFIKQAPDVDLEAGGQHIPSAEVQQLYRYYGIGSGGQEPAGAPTEEAPGRAHEPDDAMTRSEEKLRVGTETRESGRARLRKYVVTEEQQVTVPVSHEEVRVEREPITDENRDAAMRGEEITEAEHEVVLHEERPVVSKETAPVERVRASKETVTEQETVGGEVRKERIEMEEDDTSQRGRRKR